MNCSTWPSIISYRKENLSFMLTSLLLFEATARNLKIVKVNESQDVAKMKTGNRFTVICINSRKTVETYEVLIIH